MTGVALVEEIVSILVAGIVGIGEGIGAGISTLASAIFFTTTGDTTGLSVIGVCIVAFAGISLAESFGKYKSVKIGEFCKENTEPNYQIANRLITV